MAIPALIGAGASLLGGLFGSSAKKREMQMQKDFAQQGIRWKVKDAQAAGIHPLAALGAQTASYTPVGLGEPMQQAMEGVGQNISRAVQSKQTAPERALMLEGAQLDLEHKRLQNSLLASQIAITNQPGQSPAMPLASGSSPIPGQGDTNGLLDMVPMEVMKTLPGAPHREPSPVSDVGYLTTDGGGKFPVPSKEAKDRIEDMMFPSLAWAIRNNVLPMLGINQSPPSKAPPGKFWYFHPLKGYELRDIKYKPMPKRNAPATPSHIYNPYGRR